MDEYIFDGATVRIPLWRGDSVVAYAIIDASDIGLVSGYRWRYKIPSRGKVAYAVAYGGDDAKGQAMEARMHRVIMGVGPRQEVDHRDRDGLNNRRDNLRLAQRWQNGSNQGKRINNKSGYVGVFRAGNKWVAMIGHKNKNVYLGGFSESTDAARAYNKAALELKGEFAYINPLPQ